MQADDVLAVHVLRSDKTDCKSTEHSRVNTQRSRWDVPDDCTTCQLTMEEVRKI